MRPTVSALLIFLLIGAGCGTSDPPVPTEDTLPYDAFATPERVEVRGYDRDIMEPFLSRDGQYLFFNNLNDPSVNTDLFVAERIDALAFEYLGPLASANTPALEGVPTMDRDSTLYFVSTRSYDDTFSTLYRSVFADGAVQNVELVPGVSREEPGIVNFDIEVSPDGETIYFVDARFEDNAPATANLVIARRTGGGFTRAANSDEILRAVNTEALEYAAAISTDGLELFFNRVGSDGPAIYRASRLNRNKPFGSPQRVAAMNGFVEGPTFGLDDRAVYFHKRENGQFVLYRADR